MRTLIALILLLAPLARSQWLPVHSSVNVINPYYGDSLDNRFAVLPYVSDQYGYARYLKYKCDTVKLADHYTLYVHAQIPRAAHFYITQAWDTSNFDVLYTYRGSAVDNQNEPPVDTVLTIDVLPYSIFRYGKPTTSFTIRRVWFSRDSHEDIRIDGLFLKVHRDTIVVPRDTVKDTIPASVRPLPLQPSIWKFFNVLGYPIDTTCTNCIAIDQYGRKRLKR